MLAPYAYDQAVKSINAVLEAFRPKGKIEIAPMSDHARYPTSMFEEIGAGFANDLLARLVQPNDQRADVEIVGAITKRVADLHPKAGKPRR